MANLLSICELAWKQTFPNANDETPISREEFVATGKSEYAYQMWLRAMAEKREDGSFLVPSSILTQTEPLDVVDGAIDISGLKILRSLPNEVWIQNVGGLKCNCQYVKTDVNKAQLLCDDDSMADDVKTFLVIGDKIIFPKGVHAKKLPIIYANNGSRIDNKIIIDDAIGGIIRTRLIEIYGGRIGREDTSNNSSSNE